MARFCATSSSAMAAASRHAASPRAAGACGCRCAAMRASRPGRAQRGDRCGEGGVIGLPLHRQRHAIGRSGADQRRAAHLHAADGVCRVFQRSEAQRAVVMGQRRLIDDFYRCDHGLRFDAPDGAGGDAIDFHVGHSTVWASPVSA